MTIRAAPLLLLLALAACGGSDSPPGGLSRSENRELDQAAAAIDQNAMDNKEQAQ
ncbi:hypothetical protein [Sphingomonas soli]|uniref:hypothetical protein n=1 Tax=Sphingomonas soli TaxID=266127 RepID=UPI000B0DF2AA|nr:hypothetical protein [Sphingomonas soli]